MADESRSLSDENIASVVNIVEQAEALAKIENVSVAEAARRLLKYVQFTIRWAEDHAGAPSPASLPNIVRTH